MLRDRVARFSRFSQYDNNCGFPSPRVVPQVNRCREYLEASSGFLLSAWLTFPGLVPLFLGKKLSTSTRASSSSSMNSVLPTTSGECWCSYLSSSMYLAAFHNFPELALSRNSLQCEALVCSMGSGPCCGFITHLWKQIHCS